MLFFPALWLSPFASAATALEGWGLWSWCQRHSQKSTQVSGDTARGGQREDHTGAAHENGLHTTRPFHAGTLAHWNMLPECQPCAEDCGRWVSRNIVRRGQCISCGPTAWGCVVGKTPTWPQDSCPPFMFYRIPSPWEWVGPVNNNWR